MTDNSVRATRYLLIGLAVVVLLILISQYYKKQKAAGIKQEGFRSPIYDEENFYHKDKVVESFVEDESSVQPSEAAGMDQYKAVNYANSKPVEQCAPKDKLQVEDLLPKDAANSKWAQVAPAGQGDVGNQNFLTAGYMVGVNTVGPSLRNANQQIRSDPPIERMSVGPWNQTTIEYDSSRKFFEIGEC